MRKRLFEPGELDTLPAPVQRYIQAALHPHQAMVTAVTLEQVGTFNMSETTERWQKFNATQRVLTRRPGFDWNARIEIAPRIPVRVHDAYIAGRGLLHASLIGLWTLADMHDTPEVAQGELMRFLAEAAWYPTALLPSQGVSWTAVDDSSATATLRDGDTSVALRFRFNEAGLIAPVHADARGRSVQGKVVATPWEGRWWNYPPRDSLWVPTEGEVSWIMPRGPKPYWRGQITRLQYEFAR